MLNRKIGFTLIELLVVISIISLLSSVVFASVNGARMKARDARRITDIRQINLALELYYDRYNVYPQESSSNGSWEFSYEDNGDFLEALRNEGFLSRVPVDPLNTTTHTYAYYLYDDPDGEGCVTTRGRIFILATLDMEASTRPYPGSPGFSCDINFSSGPLSRVCITGAYSQPGGCRNWSSEFDYVVGAYEQ